MVSSALITSGWATLGVALAVGSLMLAASLVALARPRGAWLRHRLDPQGRLDALQAEAARRARRARLAAAAGAPLRRPERMLEGTRAWKAAMRLLERAGSHLRPAAFAWASLLIGVGAACLSAVLSLPTGVPCSRSWSASWRRRCG